MNVALSFALPPAFGFFSLALSQVLALPVNLLFLLHLSSQTMAHLCRMSSIQTSNQEAGASVLKHAGMEKHCPWNSSHPRARLSLQQPKQSSNCSHLSSGSKFQAVSWFLHHLLILNPLMAEVNNVYQADFLAPAAEVHELWLASELPALCLQYTYLGPTTDLGNRTKQR